MDYVLIDGDTANFDPTFEAATVTVRPGTLRASGPATLGQKKICIVGDEKSVVVSQCPYTTPNHPTPGFGTLEIVGLASEQQASKTKSNGTPMMLVGGSAKFTAKFTVAKKAEKPTQAGPVLDLTPSYSGTGTFATTNTKLRGS